MCTNINEDDNDGNDDDDDNDGGDDDYDNDGGDDDYDGNDDGDDNDDKSRDDNVGDDDGVMTMLMVMAKMIMIIINIQQLHPTTDILISFNSFVDPDTNRPQTNQPPDEEDRASSEANVRSSSTGECHREVYI